MTTGWLTEAMDSLITRGQAQAPWLTDGAGLQRSRITGGLLAPPLPAHLSVASLESFARAMELAQHPGEGLTRCVVVESPTRVVGHIAQCDSYGRHVVLAVAEVKPRHGFPYDRFLDAEEFLVRLQTGFLPDAGSDQETGDLRAVLELAGTLQPEKLTTLQDDGVTQIATVRRTAGRLASSMVKNPVQLYPLGLTFPEVHPPRWRLILRLKQEKDGELPKLALFQAGDLDWEGRVRKDIAGALDRLGCKGALL